jgi:site-specific recombinase XerD
MDRHAEDIRRRDLRELFDRCADQGIEREAERRRQTVGAMFRWALSQDIVEIDPTTGLKAYDPGTPRDRILTVNEIELLWKWLDSDALPQDPSDILKLELLTGARCGEISGLCAEEIGQEEWIWTLPAARSKNKRPRVTPGELVDSLPHRANRRFVSYHRRYNFEREAHWLGSTDCPGTSFNRPIGTAVQGRNRNHFNYSPCRSPPISAMRQAADRQVHHSRPSAHSSNDAG